MTGTGAEIAIITAAVAGTTMQYQAQRQQYKSASAAAKAQAAWHAYNAKLRLREEDAERQATAFEATQQKRLAGQFLAKQRARRGGSGVTMEGSPLLVMEDTAAQLALENINIRMTGTRRAQAFKSMSILDTAKASAARSTAGSIRRGGRLGAGASILQGAAQTAYMASEM